MDCNITDEAVNATQKMIALVEQHNFPNFTVSNASSSLNAPWKEKLNFSSDVLMMVVFMAFMLAMGCEVQWKSILSHLRKPIPLIIGLLMQFILLPLFSYVVLIACGIGNLHAVGVLIITCCPGGLLSNTFSYYIGGDLSLSVTMTTISTITAMGFLPANTWTYCRQFASTALVVPYQSISISAVLFTSPLPVGMLIKWKFERAGSWITKITTILSSVFIIGGMILKVVLFYEKMLHISSKLLAITLLLPVTGFAMGYSFAAVTKQTVAVRKAIGLETGVQNIPLALTIIVMSFSSEMEEELIILPLIYGSVMMGGGLLLCLISYFLKRRELSKEKSNINLNHSKLDDAETENLQLEQNKLDVIILSKDIRSKTIDDQRDFVTKVYDKGSLETLFQRREDINSALLPEIHLLLT